MTRVLQLTEAHACGDERVNANRGGGENYNRGCGWKRPGVMAAVISGTAAHRNSRAWPLVRRARPEGVGEAALPQAAVMPDALQPAAAASWPVEAVPASPLQAVVAASSRVVVPASSSRAAVPAVSQAAPAQWASTPQAEVAAADAFAAAAD
jgi:hypothetical protein